MVRSLANLVHQGSRYTTRLFCFSRLTMTTNDKIAAPSLLLPFFSFVHMKPKRPLVIDLLGDSSDEEDDVQIVETKKKIARLSENSLGTAKKTTAAGVAAMKRAGLSTENPHSNMKPAVVSSGSEETANPLMKLPVSELKHRLALQGISSHGCLEKQDLVERLMTQGTNVAITVDDERTPIVPRSNSERKVSAYRDPHGPLQDGETTTFGDKGYKIKRAGQTYYCSCPAWKWQKTAPGSGAFGKASFQYRV